MMLFAGTSIGHIPFRKRGRQPTEVKLTVREFPQVSTLKENHHITIPTRYICPSFKTRGLCGKETGKGKTSLMLQEYCLGFVMPKEATRAPIQTRNALQCYFSTQGQMGSDVVINVIPGTISTSSASTAACLSSTVCLTSCFRTSRRATLSQWESGDP